MSIENAQTFAERFIEDKSFRDKLMNIKSLVARFEFIDSEGFGGFSMQDFNEAREELGHNTKGMNFFAADWYMCLDFTKDHDHIVQDEWEPEKCMYRTRQIKQKQEQGESDNSCFIATACYGSPVYEDVILLRNFRDQVLIHSFLGKVFIQIYYRISPFWANIIKRNYLLREMVRSYIIEPWVYYT